VIPLADVFRRYAGAYRKRYVGRILPSQEKAMADIVRCRTPAMAAGGLYQCDHCGRRHFAYRSCGNRHCPTCGNEKADQWIAKAQHLRLPVDYYLITCTLPHDINAVAYAHQRVVYNAFFQASSQAIRQLALDKRFLGARVGMMGVLQTWRRDLGYHVHIHYLVPAGGVTPAGNAWRYPRNKNFLLAQKPLAILLRGKFRQAMRQAGLCAQIPAPVWEQDWVVDCLPVGNGTHCLKYLAPYIHRVALTDNRILTVQNGQVQFRYKPSGSTRWKLHTLPVLEFIARFLRHVLPRGFVKVRYYGFLASASRTALRRIRCLVLGSRSQPPQPLAVHLKPRWCPVCGGPLRLVASFLPPRRGPPTQQSSPPLQLPNSIR
jgi:hypothetical protein